MTDKDTLMNLIDAYAETRHRCGGIYNAKTEAARKAVIEALSGVQALSAAPVEVADAMADSQYLAGVSAGWNAANADDPNAALQKLHESRAGYLQPLRAARAPAEQPPRWVERWHGSGGKEFWEGWSILNAANREMIAHLGPDVDPDAVRDIVAAHNEALCGECAGNGGRWCPACAGATPTAEQQATKETSGGFHVWRDISTAPKDGSHFVATGYNYGLYSEGRHICVAQWFRGCWMETSDWNEASELQHLTHWLPLPSPPDNAAELNDLDVSVSPQQAAPKAAPGEPIAWTPGPNLFKDWCAQWFGPDSDDDYLAKAVFNLPPMAQVFKEAAPQQEAQADSQPVPVVDKCTKQQMTTEVLRRMQQQEDGHNKNPFRSLLDRLMRNEGGYSTIEIGQLKYALDGFYGAARAPADSVTAPQQEAQEPVAVPRFNCWSTNEGDSWFDHPADSQAIYDCLGNDAKVGDEYELTAGWTSVTARYRITEVVGDGEEYEVECISHPHENSAPQPAPVVGRMSPSKEWLETRLAIADDSDVQAGVPSRNARPCDAPPGCDSHNCHGCDDFKHPSPTPQPAPAPLMPRGDSAAPQLRAMATNYPPGHLWDKLDAKACIKGALEIEALRAPQPAPAPLSDDVVRDAAFEAVRKKLCALPRFSFLSDGYGAVRRVPDKSGSWIAFDAAHELFDPVAVDAALAAQGDTP